MKYGISILIAAAGLATATCCPAQSSDPRISIGFACTKQTPPARRIHVRNTDADVAPSVCLDRASYLDALAVKSMSRSIDNDSGAWSLVISLDPAKADLIKQVTGKHINSTMYLISDGTILQRGDINTAIEGAQIGVGLPTVEDGGKIAAAIRGKRNHREAARKSP
jgi:preprotein translocase subunit SecD